MNRLPGHVVSMDSEAGIALVAVRVAGGEFTAMLLGRAAEPPVWQPGEPVFLLFKESEVSLAKGLSGLLSLRNRHAAWVREVIRGRLLSRVVLDFNGLPVTAIITTGSVERLALACGDGVEWLVKANEMAVERGGP